MLPLLHVRPADRACAVLCMTRRCPRCSHASNTYDSFLDVSVELPPHAKSVTDLLKHFSVWPHTLVPVR